MTGPEHYREAERIANQCKTELAGAAPNTIDELTPVIAASAQIAQVHATLALVAVQAEYAGYVQHRIPSDWTKAVTS